MYSLRNLTLKLERPVFSDVSLEIKRGELIHITGPNGSGKTSLLRLLSGLIPSIYPGDWEGEIIFQGNPIQEVSLHKRSVITGTWAAARLFCRSLWEEVTFTAGNSPDRAAGLLKYFGLWDLRHRHPQNLSGGQQQLALLIAYLSGNRDILFLDEIYPQLSSEKAARLSKILFDLHQKGATIILVDHDLPMEVKEKARTVVLEPHTVQHDREYCELPPFKKEVALKWDTFQALQGGTPVFKPVTGNLGPGSILQVCGEIGSGKTSFLNALAGLLPYRGSVLIDGKEGRDISWKERAAKIGMVSQISDRKFFCTTVQKELFYGPRKLKRLDKEWLEHLMHTCRLSHLSEQSPYTLSHGEMKRLQMAIALSLMPGILLMDEPETNLDGPSRLIMEKLILQYISMGNRVILCSHSRWIQGSSHLTLTKEQP